MDFDRLAVLGDPIEHSRSPELHRALLELAGFQGVYRRVRVSDEFGLLEELGRLRAGDRDGLNITMPLKTLAARLADSVSPLAARAGSVNTLMRSGSEIHGESTDCAVFKELLSTDHFDRRTSILVLGTGGSAAAALAAVEGKEPIYVAGRRRDRAEELTARLGGEVISWGTAVAGALVINSTPLGMKGEDLPSGLVGVAAGLIDLPYGDAATPATHSARRMGIGLVDGDEFLLRQAVASFRLWTGHHIDYRELANRLKKV